MVTTTAAPANPNPPGGGDVGGGGFSGSTGGTGGGSVGQSGDRNYLTGYMNTKPGTFDTDASVKSDDGLLTLSIPKGTQGKTAEGWALSYITATRMTQAQQPANPQGGNVIGLPYNLGPDGTTFSPAISITLHYDKSLIPAGMSESNLVLAWWDAANSKWVNLTSTVDTAKGTITATISHFSTYAVVGFTPAAPVASATPAPTATTLPAASTTPTVAATPDRKSVV
jgi:hypothetical protein